MVVHRWWFTGCVPVQQLTVNGQLVERLTDTRSLHRCKYFTVLGASCANVAL